MEASGKEAASQHAGCVEVDSDDGGGFDEGSGGVVAEEG